MHTGSQIDCHAIGVILVIRIITIMLITPGITVLVVIIITDNVAAVDSDILETPTVGIKLVITGVRYQDLTFKQVVVTKYLITINIRHSYRTDWRRRIKDSFPCIELSKTGWIRPLPGLFTVQAYGGLTIIGRTCHIILIGVRYNFPGFRRSSVRRHAGFTGITNTVAIGILLTRVGIDRTVIIDVKYTVAIIVVITDITEGITIDVGLIKIGDQ